MPKIFQSEHTYSYATYTFGYALYAERLEGEPIDPIYAAGFLPYSGEQKAHLKGLYYMARSARVDLALYTPSSENRRVHKKFDGRRFHIEEHPAASFLANKPMLDFCLEYFEKRHGEGAMSEDRLKRILGYSPETKVVEYKDEEGAACAYVIEVQGIRSAHYWFSFYDLSLAYLSFGMWLMMDRTEHAKQQGRERYYVGTVYGDKALYKTNIPALEYWDGAGWVKNVKRLKERARTDEHRVVSQPDEFKEE